MVRFLRTAAHSLDMQNEHARDWTVARPRSPTRRRSPPAYHVTKEIIVLIDGLCDVFQILETGRRNDGIGAGVHRPSVFADRHDSTLPPPPLIMYYALRSLTGFASLCLLCFLKKVTPQVAQRRTTILVSLATSSARNGRSLDQVDTPT